MADTNPKTRERLFPMHLTPFEMYMVLDDRPDYPSTFMVGWEFSGKIDRAAFQRGVEFAYSRHPLLRAVLRQVKLDRDCWVAAESPMPRIDWGRIDDPIVLEHGETIDLRSEVGFRIWVRHDDRRAVVTCQFHHAACDGIGSCHFMGDALWSYAKEFGAELEPAPDLPIDKLRKRLRVACRLEHFLDAEGHPLERYRDTPKTLLRPTTPLSPSKSHDFSRPPSLPFPGILYAWLDANEYRRFKAASVERGLTANDFLTLKLYRTMHLWNLAQGQSADGSLCILIPFDLREPDSFDISACNIVTEGFLHRTRQYLENESLLGASIQSEMLQLRNDRHASDFMGMLTIIGRPNAPMPEALSGKFCVTTAILSNTGDTTRRFYVPLPRENGLARCGNLLVEECSGIPPLRPHSRVVISAYTYRRRLRVCMRLDGRFFTLDEAHQFLDAYMDNLRSL